MQEVQLKVLPSSKLCTRCNVVKSAGRFYKSRSKKDGLHYCCKECDRARKKQYHTQAHVKQRLREKYKQHRARVIAPRKAHVNTLKQDQPCVDCGGSFPSVCMDYDHVQAPKLFSISHWPHLVKYTEEDLQQELLKCELVCSNCHRIRTHIEGKGPVADEYK